MNAIENDVELPVEQAGINLADAEAAMAALYEGNAEAGEGAFVSDAEDEAVHVVTH